MMDTHLRPNEWVGGLVKNTVWSSLVPTTYEVSILIKKCLWEEKSTHEYKAIV